MTRLAVISDVHAEVHALKDALVQIERLGCDLVVCAGDILDFGSFPEETIALLRERDIPTIRGNHDRWALRNGQDMGGRHLTDKENSFLEGLPLEWRATLEGVRVLVTHARPGSDMKGISPDTGEQELLAIVEAADADVIICGHTHTPMSITLGGGKLVANPGALLRDPAQKHAEPAWIYDPGLGNFVQGPKPVGGTFGILELPSKRFSVHRAVDGDEVAIASVNLDRQAPRPDKGPGPAPPP